MNDRERIPFSDAEKFAVWLSRNFKGMPREMRHPVEVEDVFAVLQGRGNAREEWFDLLWLKVRALRETHCKMTWDKATERALQEWNELDEPLPNYLHNVSKASFDALVQRLKSRKRSVAELGLNRVTAAHFYVALAYAEFQIAEKLHRAANNRVRKDIHSFIRAMKTNHRA